MPIAFSAGKLNYPNCSGLATAPFSIEGWVRPEAAVQSYYVHLNTPPNTGFYTYLQQLASLQLNVGVAGQFSAYSLQTNTALSLNTWYHVACTCQNDGASSGIAIFINGVKETVFSSSGTNSNTPGNHVGHITLGGRNFDTARVTTGKLHKMRIYNTRLPDAAFASGYADPSGYDISKIFATNLVFNAALDDNLNSVPGVGSSGVAINLPSSSGLNAALTSGYPIGLPGLAFYGNFASPSNSLTSGRISTLADLSNNNCRLIEPASNGPVSVSTPSGLGVPFGAFIDTSARRLHNPTGILINNQNCSVIAWMSMDKCGVSTEQPILELGTVNATGLDGLSIFAKTNGQLAVDRRGSTQVTGYYLAACNPRMIGVVSASTGTSIYMDQQRTFGSALTQTTSTGIIVGALCGPTGDVFQGNVFAICVYQRVLSTGELQGLWQYGSPLYGYTLPTHMMSCEGSSTIDGYQAANNQNIIQRMGTSVSGILVYNFGNTSENRGHFNSQYTAQLGAASTLNGFAKANRICLLQPFGNDWNGVTTLDSIKTDYQTLINNINNDYGVLFTFAPQPRSDYSTDTEDQNREIDALDIITWFSSRSTLIPRNTVWTPASTSATDIRVVTQGAAYLGDEIHFSASGYQLAANWINTYLSAYFNQSPDVSVITLNRLNFLNALDILHILGRR